MLPPCAFTLPDHRAGFLIEGRGRPVVLLHGAADSRRVVRTLVERLSHSHRVISIDSTTQHDPNGVESVLRIGLLPAECFHLIGLSQGVAVALRIAQARPHRLHSLTLCDPAVPDDVAGTEQASTIVRVIHGIDALDLRPRAGDAVHA
jgi:pimeloyl-ACP methyl ester carboxylesterase